MTLEHSLTDARTRQHKEDQVAERFIQMQCNRNDKDTVEVTTNEERDTVKCTYTHNHDKV